MLYSSDTRTLDPCPMTFRFFSPQNGVGKKQSAKSDPWHHDITPVLKIELHTKYRLRVLHNQGCHQCIFHDDTVNFFSNCSLVAQLAKLRRCLNQKLLPKHGTDGAKRSQHHVGWKKRFQQIRVFLYVFVLHQFSYYVLTFLILFSIYICLHPQPCTRFGNFPPTGYPGQPQPQTDESVFPGLRVQFWITTSLKALWLIQTFPAWKNAGWRNGKRRLFSTKWTKRWTKWRNDHLMISPNSVSIVFSWWWSNRIRYTKKCYQEKDWFHHERKRHAAVNHRDPQIRPPSTAEWSCEMFANNSDRVGDQPASSQSFWSQHTSWWCFPRSLAQLNSASHRPS